MLLQYIPDILETPVSGHHDHRISHLDLILSAGRKDRSIPVDAADQKIILQIQIHQRHICHSRSLTDGKLPVSYTHLDVYKRQALKKASLYKAKVEAAGDDASKLPAYDQKSEALIPVLNKEIPLKAHAHQANDLCTALRIAREFDLDITLEHVTEGHMIVEDVYKRQDSQGYAPL